MSKPNNEQASYNLDFSKTLQSFQFKKLQGSASDNQFSHVKPMNSLEKQELAKLSLNRE